MATHKKEGSVVKKPSSLEVYLPQTDPNDSNPYWVVSYEEGKEKVRYITLISPRMIQIEMEDGEQIHYAGMPFTYRKYVTPAPKHTPNL